MWPGFKRVSVFTVERHPTMNNDHTTLIDQMSSHEPSRAVPSKPKGSSHLWSVLQNHECTIAVGYADVQPCGPRSK